MAGLDPVVVARLDPRVLLYGDTRSHYEKEKAKRDSAMAKAKALLNTILTDQQKVILEQWGYIPVKGGLSDTTYLIRVGYSQNIVAKDMSIAKMTMLGIKIGNRGDLRCTCSDCVSPRDRVVCCYMRLEVPYWDHMIAQILGLQYAEKEFLKVAYVS